MRAAVLDRLRQSVALLVCYACSLPLAPGQNVAAQLPPAIEPVRASAPWFLRAYEPTQTPPIRLSNSARLASLVRGGNLYLTAQDAIALALENNIDIEVARYNPISTVWELERLEAGGSLPGVPSGASQVNSGASGQGVNGAQSAAGVTTGQNVGVGATGGNATIQQIGPVTQNLDPSIQQSASWSHQTQPQTNTILSQTNSLVSNTRNYTTTAQVGTLSGGTFTLSYNESYLNQNSPSNFLNPSVAPSLVFSFQHNLLSGFGEAVNARSINAQKVNIKTSDLNFRSTVISTVVNVLNAYYGLVADYEDIKAKQSAHDTALKFYEDNKKQVEIGTMAPLDVISAESQVASTEQDFVVSQTALQQQEAILKNIVSRTGMADPILAHVRVIPVDRIIVPDTDEFLPTKQLVSRALGIRPDLAAEQNGIATAEINALGTQNGVRPFAVVFGGATDRGLSGVARTFRDRFTGETLTADPYFVGGIGNALGQIFRHNFPSERIGVFFQAPIFNRQAQADQAIAELSIRQSQLTTQKDVSQVTVDVANYIVSVRQARARYQAAVRNRILEQQLLDAEQKKFSLGASTPYNIITQQRDLSAAQSTEVAALVSYSRSKIALDQVLGITLETNHVNIDEAIRGSVAQISTPPPAQP